MNPVQRVIHHRDMAVDQVRQLAPKLKLTTEAAQAIDRAIMLDHARLAALRAKRAQTGKKTVGPAQTLAVEIAVAKQFGLVPAGVDVEMVERNAWHFEKQGKGDLVRKASFEFWDQVMPKLGSDRILTIWRKALEEKGYKYLGREQ